MTDIEKLEDFLSGLPATNQTITGHFSIPGFTTDVPTYVSNGADSREMNFGQLERDPQRN